MKKILPYVFLLSTLSLNPLGAQESCCFCDIPFYPWPHKFYLGPDFYNVKRERKGGTRQDGWVYGTRFSYERIAPWSLYWGFNANYASGTIHGHTNTHRPLKSQFIDWHVGGRFGFTFQGDSILQAALTPYIGTGYLNESNNYKHPSPVPVHFEIYYPYVSIGFVTSFQFKPNFTFGLNFEAMGVYEPKCRVTKDPEFDNRTMLIGDRVNYRFEIPIVYEIPIRCKHFQVGLMPFFEIRQYGGRENYPFDFVRTRVDIYGFNLQFILRI